MTRTEKIALPTLIALAMGALLLIIINAFDDRGCFTDQTHGTLTTAVTYRCD